MASDSEVKNSQAKNFDIIDNYRKLVQTYIGLHIYQAALFWADKVVVLTSSNPKDVYKLAQCMYLLKQYHRAAHLLRSKNLDKTYILCNTLTVRCLLEANELNEALKVLNSIDLDVFLQNSLNEANAAEVFDETPQHQVQSSVLLLKGKVLEAMDNRGLASDCYRQAIQCDIHCYEAFESLIQHHMLTADEEEELLNSLPLSQQCSPEEADILLMLYRSKLKKYHVPSEMNVLKYKGMESACNMQNSTPCQSVYLFNKIPVTLSTPNVIHLKDGNKTKSRDETNHERKVLQIQMSLVPLVKELLGSLDMAVAEAETLYYNCDYQRCNLLTELILKQDPYHSTCLPIYISCQVELMQSNKLFTLAHNLVDLYPNLAISWYAVGCYYYIIGKSDSARRYLAKATTLDRLFGPAWLAYGHSFAVENEHDQAMAAYFKASQLMRGCHLPLLYIGLECGLTNNVVLAGKFFYQAIKLAPRDPFVLQEMGVITFQTSNYDVAEKHFRDALKIVKGNNYHTLLPERWAPLLNNLGHTLRKQKKYEEALKCHQEALVLCPQAANTYSCIAYVYSLLGNLGEAVNWFHKALGLKRDDTFSTTMLNYVLEHLSEDESPYPGAPNNVPSFSKEMISENSTQTSEDISYLISTNVSNVNLDITSIEIDMLDVTKE